MSPAIVEAVIGVCTVVLSVTGSAFVAGTRWGRVESEMKDMATRLAKIEAMFTLTLKEPGMERRR